MLKSPLWASFKSFGSVKLSCKGHENAVALRPMLGVSRARLAATCQSKALKRACRPFAVSSTLTSGRVEVGRPPAPAPQMGKPIEIPTVDAADVHGTVPLRIQSRTLKCQTGHRILDDLNMTHLSASLTADSSSAVFSMVNPDGPCSSFDIEIGKISASRFLACARCKLWWMTPEMGSRMEELPPETQFLLLELQQGGPYALILPLISGDFRATLRYTKGRDKKDVLSLRIESGDEAVLADHWENVVLVASGMDPYELVDTAVAAAAKMSGDALPLSQKQLPMALDVFGWCTWDAFYSTVSAAGLREGLKSLTAAGLRPKFLIIDDGWQLTDVPVFEGNDIPEAVQQQEASILAEALHQLPQGSTAGTAMPTLGGVGPAPHHPHEARPHPDSDSNKPLLVPSIGSSTALQKASSAASTDGLLVQIAQQVAGWMMGIGTAAILLLYQLLVDPAPPNSFPVKAWAALARGPLRLPLLSFYGTASDFTRRLVSVKANAKFSSINAGPDLDWQAKPARLGDVVDCIKQEFGIKFVYCWHGLPAYWGGIMPGSEIGSKHKARVVYAKPTEGLLEIEPSVAWNPAVLGGVGVVDDPDLLFTEMHDYLSGNKIDGVKVDCQAGVGLMGSMLGGGPSLSRRFHAALEDSVRRHFPGNHLINCMCHSTENLYRMTWSAVARASDDFFPRDAASSTPHINSCAYNSIFLGALVQPDWDMFQSKHPAAKLHGIARAVSGGPVYVSDRPGEHDLELLRRLVLPDGSILRASRPGRPTRDCLFTDVLRDGKTALKVWSMNKCTGVVGVFHLQGSSWDRRRRRFHVHHRSPPPLTTRVSPSDVQPFNRPAALDAAGPAPRFAVYAHNSGEISVLEAHEGVQVEVTTGNADVLTISPISTQGPISFAPLGLTDMFNGGAAVVSCTATSTPFSLPPATSRTLPATSTTSASSTNSASSPPTNSTLEPRPVFSVTARGCGSFSAYSDAAPEAVLVDGMWGAWQWEQGKLKVELPQTASLQAELQFVFQPC